MLRKIKVIKPSDLRIPRGYSLKKIGITQSLCDTDRTCPRLLLYKLNRYFDPDDKHTFLFGNICHYTLEMMYRNSDTDIATIIDSFVENNQEDIAGILPEKVNFQLRVAHVIMKNYLQFYDDEFKTKTFEDLEREVSIIFKNKYRLNMKMDGKFLDNYGNKWLMEHKTKSRISEDALMMRLSFDFQNLFYLTGGEIFYNEDIFGVLYNVIRNPSIKPKAKETDEDYFIRLDLDIKKRLDFYFIRYEIPYTKKSKEEFQLELESYLDRLNKRLKKFNFYNFEKRTRSCEFPFSCKFIKACARRSMSGYEQNEFLFPELKTIERS